MAQTYGVNPYAYGAQVFDTTPYTKVFLERQAKEQAKQEALDKYFREQLVKDVNTRGLRSKEQALISQIANERRLFASDKRNLEALKRGDLDALQRFYRYGSDIQDVLNGGLEIQNRAKEINSAIQKKKYGVTDRFMQQELPAFMEEPRFIYVNGELKDNPKFKMLGVADIEENTKPWDINDDTRLRTYLTSGLKESELGEPIYRPLSTDKDREQAYIRKGLTNEAKRQFEERALAAYNTDDRFREKVIPSLPKEKYEQLFDRAVRNYAGAIADGANPEQFVAVEYLKDNYMPQDREEAQGQAQLTRAARMKEYEKQQQLQKKYSSSGGGSGKSAAQFVKDIKDIAEYKKEGKIEDMLMNMSAGNNFDVDITGVVREGNKFKLKFKEFYTYVDNGGGLKIKTKVPNPDEQEVVIDFDDPQVYRRLGKIYQRFTGSDAKMEKELISSPEFDNPIANKPKEENKTVKYSVDGKIYNIPLSESVDFLKEFPKAKKL